MQIPAIGRAGNYFGTVTRRRATRASLLTDTEYRGFASIPTHLHDTPALVLVTAGAFRERTAGATTRLGPGAISYHPPGEPHSAEADAGTRALNIEFLAHERSRAWENIPSAGELHRLTAVATRMLAACRRRDATWKLAIEELALEAEGVLGRPRRGTRRPSWLAPVVEAVRASPKAPSVARLAREVGADPSTVFRAFRAFMGCTPSAYVRQLRLAQARETLASTRMPISRVAQRAGFYDHAHFTRTFHRLMGLTPGEYRRVMTFPGAAGS